MYYGLLIFREILAGQLQMVHKLDIEIILNGALLTGEPCMHPDPIESDGR